MMVWVSVSLLFGRSKLLGNPKPEARHGGNRRPGNVLGCLSRQGVSPLVARDSGMAFDPSDLGGLAFSNIDD
jgi:hypothetical protein